MISIVYITFREECKFEWFITSIIKQYQEQYFNFKIQIIVVDGLFDTRDKDFFMNMIKEKEHFLELVHVLPKPTLWQGKHRVTSENYFAASNARNTGACYAKYSYIAFHDDLGCPSQSWLNSVCLAMKNNVIQCGAYTKYSNMNVVDGIMVSGEALNSDIDVRLSYYKNNISKCDPAHFFGSSFCMPLKKYFEINGMNEMNDGCGGEDYDFGYRLFRNNNSIYYNKSMFIAESKTAFGSDVNRTCLRVDCKKDPKDPKSDLSHYLLNYCINGPIVANEEFKLKDYNYKINVLKMNSEDVFIIPNDRIHFFTEKLVSNGLII